MLSRLHEVADKYAVSLQMMFHWQGMKCMSFGQQWEDSNLQRFRRHNAFQQIKDVIQQLHQHNQSNHTWKPKIKSSILWNITCKSNPQDTLSLSVQEHSQHLWLHLALRSEGNQGNEARSWEATNLHSVGLAVPTTTGRSVNSTPSKMIKRKLEDKKIKITRCWRYHTHSQPLAHESLVRGCWRYMVLP